MKLARRLLAQWRRRGDRFRYGRDRNASPWENETTGTDILNFMVKQKGRAIPRRKEKLP